MCTCGFFVSGGMGWFWGDAAARIGFGVVCAKLESYAFDSSVSRF